MTDTHAAIEASKLVIKKERQAVVDGLTFSVFPGAVTGLIGPSGSGKTTLMRAMVGVQALSSGVLNVLGKPAGTAALRKRIGYVTQAPAVYPDLTVMQNLRYFASIIGVGKESINRVIEQVDLEAHRNQVVMTLSGGQHSRVSLAVALLGDPELLILDEPTVGLDPLLRDRLWGIFRELAKQGKTLLVSSHVMDEAARCDNLLLLREGNLIADASPGKLLEATRTNTLDAAFLAIIRQHDEEATS